MTKMLQALLCKKTVAGIILQKTVAGIILQGWGQWRQAEGRGHDLRSMPYFVCFCQKCFWCFVIVVVVWGNFPHGQNLRSVPCDVGWKFLSTLCVSEVRTLYDVGWNFCPFLSFCFFWYFSLLLLLFREIFLTVFHENVTEH